MTGLHDVDEFIQAQLLLAVGLTFAPLIIVGFEYYHACVETWRLLCCEGCCSPLIVDVEDLSWQRHHASLLAAEALLLRSHVRQAP